MKKNYFIIVAVFCVFVFSNAKSQEMIVGGNMEDSTAWIQTPLNGDSNQVVNVEFNYTLDFPIEGDGGCLHVSTQTDGFMVHYGFYQAVTLQRGVEYTFNLAYKNTIEFLNYWFEVWVGGNEPEVGSDYGSDQGAELVGGFKFSGWEAGCSDLVDGSFTVDQCLPDSNAGIITYEGTGDTTVFLVIRFGMGWETITSDFMIDEVSLEGPATSVRELTEGQTMNFVYPNPAGDYIKISNVWCNELQIYDVVGKMMFSTRNVWNEMQIDISDYSKGVYIVKAGNYISRFIKH